MEWLQRIPWIFYVLVTALVMAPVRAFRVARLECRRGQYTPDRTEVALGFMAAGFAEATCAAITLLTVYVLFVFLPTLCGLLPQTLITVIAGAVLVVASCGLAVVSAGMMAAACVVSLRNGTRLWIPDHNFLAPSCPVIPGRSGCEKPAMMLVVCAAVCFAVPMLVSDSVDVWQLVVVILMAGWAAIALLHWSLAQPRTDWPGGYGSSPGRDRDDDDGGPEDAPCPVPAPRRPPGLSAHATPQTG